MLRIFTIFLVLGLLAGTGSAQDAFEFDDGFQPCNRIDEIVLADLQKKGISPAKRCSDAVFLRRVCLDVLGTLPTMDEVKAFLNDTNPDKRSVLVDSLLERPEFTDFQTLRWCDFLRVKSEYPINLWPHGAATYYRWIHESIRTNKPYDRFAYELLLGQGSNFRDGPANFYRAVENKIPESLAEAAALTFLGERTDLWPDEKRVQLTTFFSRVAYKATAQWKEEIVFFDRTPLENSEVVFPDGTRGTVVPGQDPREIFAKWLIRPENAAFSQNLANRVWYWLFGVGIVNPPDDFRSANPTANPELLAYLGQFLVDSGYDTKALYRLILNSRTYQQSSLTVQDEELARSNFAVYPIRRLEAETLQDMFIQLFDLKISYVSEVPEPFAYLPERVRTIWLQDSGITNSFLEMFGRPTRDSGLTTDRNAEVNEAQLLFLMNSTELNGWVNAKSKNFFDKVWKLKGEERRRTLDNTCTRIWLTFLSRYPTDAERETFFELMETGNGGEILWSILNTREFLCHH